MYLREMFIFSILFQCIKLFQGKNANIFENSALFKQHKLRADLGWGEGKQRGVSSTPWCFIVSYPLHLTNQNKIQINNKIILKMIKILNNDWKSTSTKYLESAKLAVTQCIDCKNIYVLFHANCFWPVHGITNNQK